MSRSPFGWAYPAGAEHDPSAPYNDPPEPDSECPTCGGPVYHCGGVPRHDGEYCSPECEVRGGVVNTLRECCGEMLLGDGTHRTVADCCDQIDAILDTLVSDLDMSRAVVKSGAQSTAKVVERAERAEADLATTRDIAAGRLDRLGEVTRERDEARESQKRCVAIALEVENQQEEENREHDEEIAALRAEVERLRTRLLWTHSALGRGVPRYQVQMVIICALAPVSEDEYRAALAEGEGGE